MKPVQIEFSDDEVIATVLAMDDFILKVQLLMSNKSVWKHVPDLEQMKYRDLIAHVTSVHDKFLALYQEVKREFN